LKCSSFHLLDFPPLLCACKLCLSLTFPLRRDTEFLFFFFFSPLIFSPFSPGSRRVFSSFFPHIEASFGLQLTISFFFSHQHFFRLTYLPLISGLIPFCRPPMTPHPSGFFPPSLVPPFTFLIVPWAPFFFFSFEVPPPLSPHLPSPLTVAFRGSPLFSGVAFPLSMEGTQFLRALVICFPPAVFPLALAVPSFFSNLVFLVVDFFRPTKTPPFSLVYAPPFLFFF